ncbi:MAG TPA: T9SS type A sorting domain-containing protein, partial [Bacteroidia bacterium]|nr:T9SS type A sorting domain-containing protein [Bacteroidia bacterium]
GTPTVSTSAVILWGTTAGNVGVKAVNGCGVSGTRTLPVSISCRVAQTVNESNGVDTKVYPNPAHGQFNVSFNAAIAENFTLKVLDQTGRIVKQEVINAQEGNNVQQLEVSELAPGIYLVVLESKQTGLSKYPLLLQ